MHRSRSQMKRVLKERCKASLTHVALFRRVKSQTDALGLNQSASVIIGVSGGKDSAVLLHILCEIFKNPKKIIAVHVNHQTRKSAHQDATVSKVLAKMHGVRFVGVKAQWKKNEKITEESLRKKRLEALTKVLVKTKSKGVFLAHHEQDQAETFLLRLISGSNVWGLTGMRPVRDSIFFRPMLGVPKSMIETEVKQCQLPYVEDPTNRSLTYFRNRIRRQLLTMLKKENPQIVAQLASLADRWALGIDFVNEAAHQWLSEHKRASEVPRNVLQSLHPFLREAVLRQWLSPVLLQKGPSRQWLEMFEKWLSHPKHHRLQVKGSHALEMRKKGMVRLIKV